MVRLPLSVLLFAQSVAAFGTSGGDECPETTATSTGGATDGFCLYCDAGTYMDYETCYASIQEEMYDDEANPTVYDETMNPTSADDCYDYCSAQHSDLVCWRYKQENSHSWVDGYYVDGYYVDGEWVDGYQVDGYSNVTYYPKCCCTVEGDATFPDDFAFYISYDDDDEEGEEEAVALEAIPVGVVDGEDGTCITLPSPDAMECFSDCCFEEKYSYSYTDPDCDPCTILSEGTDDCLADCDACDIESYYDWFAVRDGCDGNSTRRGSYSRRLASSKSDSKFADKLQRT